jgi:hypothetical protein
MARNTLLDLAVAYASKGTQAIIDSLVKESAILRTAGVEFANNGFKHTFPVVTQLPGVSVRGLNEGTSPTKGVKSLREVSLKIFESKQSEDYLTCDNFPGGVQKFFAGNAALYAEALAQALSTTMVYGTHATLGNTKGFKGLIKSAKDNSNIIQGTGASGSQYSILAVRWKPGVCGLVVPTHQGKSLDQFLNVKVLNGGNPVSIPTGTSDEEITVYQAVYNILAGLQVGSTYSVGAIVRMQNTTGKKPTATDMNNLVDSVRNNPGDGITFLYANRTARSNIADLKDSKYYSLLQDKDYNNVLEFWRGVPILTDDNMVSTETDDLTA